MFGKDAPAMPMMGSRGMGMSDGDSDDGGSPIPSGHRLSSISLSAADNGGVTVNHTTKKIAPGKKDGYESTYKDHSNVFGSHGKALRHVGRILKAHAGSLGKRFSSGRKSGR